MCLAAFALNAHPRFPLVLAANRDEFFARPTAAMDWWADAPDLLAGRDLTAGGSWFGLTRSGRLALLTNVREPGRNDPSAPSRGALVTDWLRSNAPFADFAAQQLTAGHNGFNLIAADVPSNTWHWLSNRIPAPKRLGPGLYALSNAELDTPWPKTTGLRAAFADALAQSADAPSLIERLLAVLADDTAAPDATLPDTGVGLERERLLSPRFIRIPPLPGAAVYGTRCSTVLVREADGATWVVERSVTANGESLPRRVHQLPRWPA